MVSTDYENYAITYTCTPKTVMYERDDINVYTRESPGFGMISPEVEQKIRDEFARIFGPETHDKAEYEE